MFQGLHLGSSFVVWFLVGLREGSCISGGERREKGKFERKKAYGVGLEQHTLFLGNEQQGDPGGQGRDEESVAEDAVM